MRCDEQSGHSSRHPSPPLTPQRIRTRRPCSAGHPAPVSCTAKARRTQQGFKVNTADEPMLTLGSRFKKMPGSTHLTAENLDFLPSQLEEAPVEMTLADHRKHHRKVSALVSALQYCCAAAPHMCIEKGNVCTQRRGTVGNSEPPWIPWILSGSS